MRPADLVTRDSAHAQWLVERGHLTDARLGELLSDANAGEISACGGLAAWLVGRAAIPEEVASQLPTHSPTSAGEVTVRQAHFSPPTPETATVVAHTPSQATTGPRRSGAAADLDPQVKVIGRYLIDEVLGKGGMGVVYKAFDPDLKRIVALKVLGLAEREDREAIDRFFREARTAGGLRHPGIIAVHEVGQFENVPYVAMEYIDGDPLWQWVRDRTPEAWPVRARVALFRDVARAVQHAHQHGIVHRDLKSSNVMVDRSGRAVVLDFGLARHIDGSSRVTMTGAFLGTPGYMPPEQLDGDSKAIGAYTDVFALGVILYELLTTKLPFQGDSPASTIARTLAGRYPALRQLNPRIHPDLETICAKALELEWSRRYADAGALADDIERFLANEPIRARPIGRARRVVKWLQRHRGVAVGAACAATVSLALLGVGLWAWTRPAILRVRVRPPDAVVLVAGKPVPATGEVRTVEVPPGTHPVRVTREGWVEAVREEGPLVRREIRDVVIELERETGTVVIDAFPAQGVEVDHAGGVIPYMNLKTRKIELKVPTGRHVIGIGREGHYREQVAVEVARDATVERRVTFRRALIWRLTALDWGTQRSAGDLDGDGLPDLIARTFSNVVVVSGRTGELRLEDTVLTPGHSFAAPLDVNGDGAAEWVTCRVTAEGRPELTALSALRVNRLTPLWSTPVEGVLTVRRYRESRRGPPRFEIRGLGVVEGDPLPGVADSDDLSRGTGPYAEAFLVRSEGDLDGDGIADLLAMFEGGEIRAYSARTGAPLWSFIPPEPTWRIAPAGWEGARITRLLLASDRRWTALDARSGAKQWECAFEEPPWLPALPVPGGLATAVGATWRRVDAESGREADRRAWNPQPSAERPVHVLGGWLLQGAAAGARVDLWSLADGRHLWGRDADLAPAGARATDLEPDGAPDLIGLSRDGARLVAVSGTDGEPRWSWTAPAPVGSWTEWPAPSPDRPRALLVGAGSAVLLLDPRTGAPQWTRELPAPISAGPLVVDIDSDGRGDLVAGTEGGHLVALDDQGGEKFAAQMGQPIRGIQPLHADYDGLRDFVLWLPDGSCAVRSPKVIWRRKTDRQVRAQPTLHDVNGDGVPDLILPLLDTGVEWPVTALDGRDGSTLWEERHSLDMARPVAVADLDGDGRAEVVTWHKDAHALRLLDAATGAKVADVELPAFGYAEPTLADLDGDGAPDILALGWYEGATYAAVSGKTRRILWQGRSEVPAWSGATFADADDDGAPEAFFVTRAGDVFALRGRTGAVVWRQSVGDGKTPTSAAVGLVRLAAGAPLTAVVSGGDRRLYLFDAATGRLETTISDAGGTASRPAFLDADGDGTFEIVVGGLDGVACVNRNGERRWFVRAGTVGGDPVIADLDGDGKLEVLFGNTGGLAFCVDAATGRVRWAWSAAPDDEGADPAAPARDQIEATLALADFDRDGILDVIVTSHNGTITCVSGRGRLGD